MKKGWKIFLAVCGSAAALGLVLCIVGALMGAPLGEVEGILEGYRHRHERNTRIETGTGEETDSSAKTFQGIRCMEIEVGGIDVEFLPSEEEYVYVESSGMKKEYNFQCYQENNTLEIHTTDKKSVFIGLQEYGTVRIYVPEGQLEEVDISNEMGTVTVNGVNTKELEIEVGAGVGTLSDVAAQNAELTCGAGNITLSGEITGAVDIDCGMGEVTLNLVGSEEDYGYEVDCGMGEVIIGGQSFSGIGIEHHASSHHSNSSHHRKHISAECGMGCVEVSFGQ